MVGLVYSANGYLLRVSQNSIHDFNNKIMVLENSDDVVEFNFKDGRVVRMKNEPDKVVDFVLKNIDDLKTTQFTPQRKPFTSLPS